jgi:hypothetical protein
VWVKEVKRGDLSLSRPIYLLDTTMSCSFYYLATSEFILLIMLHYFELLQYIPLIAYEPSPLVLYGVPTQPLALGYIPALSSRIWAILACALTAGSSLLYNTTPVGPCAAARPIPLVPFALFLLCQCSDTPKERPSAPLGRRIIIHNLPSILPTC